MQLLINKGDDIIIIIGDKGYGAPFLLNSIVIVPLFLLTFVIVVWRQKKIRRLNIFRLLTEILLMIYFYLLISITIFPISIFPPGNAIYRLPFGKQIMTNFNILLLPDLSKFQIFGNVLMLIPLTFLMALLADKFRILKYSILLSISASLCIEITQLIMNFFYLGMRIFDINDVLLNTLGGLIGFTLFLLVKRFLPREIALIA